MIKQLRIFIMKTGLIFARQIDNHNPNSVGCIEITIPVELSLTDVEKRITIFLEGIRNEIRLKNNNLVKTLNLTEICNN